VSRASTRKPDAKLDKMLEAFRNHNSETSAVVVRALERVRAGTDFEKAWRLALAERLRESQSAELQRLAADLLLEECEPKLETEWKRDPQRDREQIDLYAKWLKEEEGVRVGYRGKAEEIVAYLQHVTVDALRQRRYRPRGSRRRTPKV
jgi:hypothetical protein